MVKIGVYVETEEARVNVESKDPTVVNAAEGAPGTAAGSPGIIRLIEIAACVATCISGTARQNAAAAAAEKGGQHQTPPTDTKPNPHGRPRA